MNINDARYLLSALIQILPVVLSLNLITIFTFYKNQFEHYKSILIIVTITMISIGINMFVLNELTDMISKYQFIVQGAFFLSYLVIGLQFGYLSNVIYSKSKDKK